MRRLQAGLVLALVASTAGAQSLTGAIAGIVKDPQGGALPGATISLQGRTGTTNATTDARGEYRFPAVEPGTYSLRVEMPGFKPQRRDGIGIHAGEQLTIDFALSVGSLTDSVDVVAAAPLVDVRSSSFSIGLTQDQLFNIPLTREAQDLADATPGINRGSAFGSNENSNAATPGERWQRRTFSPLSWRRTRPSLIPPLPRGSST